MTDIANAIPARKASTISIRKVLGTIHLWVGVIFSLPFAAIGLTGSLWMIVRDTPAPIVAAAGPAHSIAEYIDAARGQAPEGMRPMQFEAPISDKPAAVRFGGGGRPQGGPRAEGGAEKAAEKGPEGRPAGPPGGFGPRVTVDPATMAAGVAPQGNAGFARLMHDIHGNLLIEGGFGRQFVGWLGVFMTALGLSGIVMWWPKRGQWKRAFKVKLNAGLLRAVYDLHRFFGILTLIVFMIVCVSGVYIVFPQAVNAVFGANAQVRDARMQAPMPVTPIEGETALDPDAVAEIAKGAVEGGILRGVAMPANPRAPYRVTFSKPGDMTGAPQVTVSVDPWAKKVIDVRDPDAYGANSKFLAWQRPLHSGSGLGMAWWVLVFISGLLPPLFAFTGVAMWWMRRRGKRVAS